MVVIVLLNCMTVVNNCECEVSSLSITGKFKISMNKINILFYFPEILTQVVVCFDQACGQILFPLYFTKICSPMWYGKFRLVYSWTNTWTVAAEILFADGCRLQFSACFNKYFFASRWFIITFPPLSTLFL